MRPVYLLHLHFSIAHAQQLTIAISGGRHMHLTRGTCRQQLLMLVHSTTQHDNYLGPSLSTLGPGSN